MSGIELRATLEVVLAGGFCGALGFWVLSERLAYAGESLSHGMLPGLVLAALAGAPLLLGAAGGALVAAGLIALAARDARVGPDTGTAVAVTGLVGLGSLLALAPEAPQRLEELLFGDPLGVSDGDLAAAAILLVAGGAALAALRRPLAATAFDPAGASALGLRPGLVRLALLGSDGRGDLGRRPGPGGAAGARRAGRPAGGRAAPRAHPGRGDDRRRRASRPPPGWPGSSCRRWPAAPPGRRWRSCCAPRPPWARSCPRAAASSRSTLGSSSRSAGCEPICGSARSNAATTAGRTGCPRSGSARRARPRPSAPGRRRAP